MSNKPRLNRLARKPRTEEVTFPLDPNDARRLGMARVRALSARMTVSELGRRLEAGEKVDDTEAQEKLELVEAELEQMLAEVDTMTFHLEGLPPARVEALITEHQPTAEQQKKHRKAAALEGQANSRLRWNRETFPPALIAEAVEHVSFSEVGADDIDDLTAEEVSEVFTTGVGWPLEDQDALFETALELSEKATKITRDAVGNGSASTTGSVSPPATA